MKGRRLDVEGAIRTRSRAATQAEQWQVVSARVKIFALLADMLIEAREGAHVRHSLLNFGFGTACPTVHLFPAGIFMVLYPCEGP